jgi:hypothetical protein
MLLSVRAYEGRYPLIASSLLFLLLFLFLLFLVLILPLSLHDGSGNTIQVPLTVLGYSSSTVLGLLQDTDLFERLTHFALDVGGGIGVVGGPVAPAVAAAMELGEGADTDVFSEVDVSCNSGLRLCIQPRRWIDRSK